MKNLFHTMTSLHLQKMGSLKVSALLLAFCIISLTPAIAQKQYDLGSTVTIDSWDNQPFNIEINNERYRANGSITLRDLRPGKARVRVFRNTANTHHMNAYGSRGRGQMLYNGFIDVPRRSRVRAKVTHNRRMKIVDVRRIGNQRPQIHNRPNRPSQGSCSDSGYGQIEARPYEQSHGFEPYSYEHTNNYGGACAMEYSQFDILLQELDNACFSSDKMRVLNQALRHNFIDTHQLERLLNEFHFDSDRLEAAKISYESVIDKENIWRINDAFSFSSTAAAFEDFICSE